MADRRSTLKVPIRLIAMIVSNGSSGCGPFEPATFWAQPVPAQQTAMRRPPSTAAATSTASCTWLSSRTSQATNATPSSCGQLCSGVGVDVCDRHDRAAGLQLAGRRLSEARGPARHECCSSRRCLTTGQTTGCAAPRQRQREQAVRVGEPAHELQARCRQVALDALGGELRADLGAQSPRPSSKWTGRSSARIDACRSRAGPAAASRSTRARGRTARRGRSRRGRSRPASSRLSTCRTLRLNAAVTPWESS